MPGHGDYGTAKAAMGAATRQLATELGQYGIRVNSARMGWMWGPPVEGALRRRAEAQGISMEQMVATLAPTAALLPANKPRYLMGVGRPEDLLAGVACGVDLFDCVLPTRNGRNAAAFTAAGVVRMRNASHRRDPRPLESDCPCYTCRHFSRAYLHHLFHADEMLGPTLLSLHNVAFYLRLMGGVRQAIEEGRFDAFRAEYNHQRPHQALGQLTPASFYSPSPRSMPRRLPEPEYGSDLIVRKVRSRGDIKWRGELVHISSALAGEGVGIEEIDNGWRVWFYRQPIGLIDQQGRRLLPIKPGSTVTHQSAGQSEGRRRWGHTQLSARD